MNDKEEKEKKKIIDEKIDKIQNKMLDKKLRELEKEEKEIRRVDEKGNEIELSEEDIERIKEKERRVKEDLQAEVGDINFYDVDNATSTNTMKFPLPENTPEELIEQINKAIETIKTQESIIENQNDLIALLAKEGFGTEINENSEIDNNTTLLQMLSQMLTHKKEKPIDFNHYGIELKLTPKALDALLHVYSMSISKKEEKFKIMVELSERITTSFANLYSQALQPLKKSEVKQPEPK